MELETATKTYRVVCRGTESIPEFLISLGHEFSFNSYYKTPLDQSLTEAEKKVFPGEKGAIKSSFSRFMNARILGKDVNGKEVTLLESPMQQTRNIIKTLKEGYKVQVIGHSVGTAAGNMFCMLLGLSRKKFGTCSALYFGPFPVYDKMAAKFVSTTFPGEIENIMCTNDFISRMSSFWAAVGVGFLSESARPSFLKTETTSKSFVVSWISNDVADLSLKLAYRANISFPIAHRKAFCVSHETGIGIGILPQIRLLPESLGVR